MLKRLLGDSISLVFGNLETVFKVCGSWFVLQFVLSVIILIATGSTNADVTTMSLSTGLLVLVAAVVAILSSASIGVAWHRFGLLGEEPGPIHLRFGAVELKFVGKLIVLTLIALAVSIPVGVLFMLLSAAVPPAVSGAFIVALFLFWLGPNLARLNLVLPATAVERPIGIQDAFHLGYGFGWRMLVAAVLLTLPFVLVSAGLQLILEYAVAGLPVLLIQLKVMILNVLLQIIVTVLGISVITAAYRMAMEQQQGA